MNAAVPSSMVENTANVSIPVTLTLISSLYASSLKVISKDALIKTRFVRLTEGSLVSESLL